MNVYLFVVLFILIGSYLLDLIVETLNIKNISNILPTEFEGFYDAEKYKKSQNYLRENTLFSLITNSIFTPLTIIFILIGGFNYVDKIARSLKFNEIATGLIFTAILIYGIDLLHIPFYIYDTFVIEEKYGFNRTNVKTFISDILKKWLLMLIIGGMAFYVILWFFIKTGSSAWLWCWIAMTIFQVLLVFITPIIILPLFNKFSPLEENELKNSIENYLKSQNFIIKGIYKMDGSRRTTKSNAFLTGFGRFRRIALFDTLIEKHTVEELTSILAHEVGHYKKKHILINIFTSILTSGIMFYILSLFLNNKALFEAFKMENISIYASLFFFGFLFAPISMLLSIVSNAISRKLEYEADIYAVKTYGNSEAFITALKKLSVDNLSNLTPHPLKVFLNYTHPPVLSRINAIRNFSIPINTI